MENVNNEFANFVRLIGFFLSGATDKYQKVAVAKSSTTEIWKVFQSFSSGR